MIQFGTGGAPSNWTTTIGEIIQNGNVLTPTQIQDAFSLPNTPTGVSIVSGYPAGSTFYVSEAAANAFGDGGAGQIFATGAADLAQDAPTPIEEALPIIIGLGLGLQAHPAPPVLISR
ncbi:MAG: hypothetical protein ACYDA5_00550 [Vulcanimicrobiaceae bacterium]